MSLYTPPGGEGGSDEGEKMPPKDLQQLAWCVARVGYGAPLISSLLLPVVGGYWGLCVRGLLATAVLTGVCLVPVLVQYVKKDEHFQKTRLLAKELLARVHYLELLRTVVDAAIQAESFPSLRIETTENGGLTLFKEEPHSYHHRERRREAEKRRKRELHEAEKREREGKEVERREREAASRERELDWELTKERDSNKSMRKRLQKLKGVYQSRAEDWQQLLDKQKELQKEGEKLEETLHVERKRSSKLQSELQRERNARQLLEAQLLEKEEVVRTLQEKVARVNSERDTMRLRQAKKDGGGECVVCMKNKRQLLLRPCNHFCVCGECSDILQGKCPICRKLIQRTERVYA